MSRFSLLFVFFVALPWSLLCGMCVAAAAEESVVTLAGPAMGTTYRVTLARGVSGLRDGELHREVEAVLARLDRALSTWRDDSDASRVNRAPAGEWVAVSADLVAVVEIARRVHAESRGAFDITAAPAGGGRPAGMRHLESRAAPPSIRKQFDGLAIDLGGIGPGFAVDAIGDRLVAIGSTDHLVELGGEVRAWGHRADGGKWRVRLRHADGKGPPGEVIELAAGEAVATSTVRPGRSPLDPRTGRVVESRRGSATVRGASCAEADAWAVATLVLDASSDED
ncbi:MAG: FAD:protein FMN transferase [Planctomycetia bacterium]